MLPVKIYVCMPNMMKVLRNLKENINSVEINWNNRATKKQTNQQHLKHQSATFQHQQQNNDNELKEKRKKLVAHFTDVDINIQLILVFIHKYVSVVVSICRQYVIKVTNYTNFKISQKKKEELKFLFKKGIYLKWNKFKIFVVFRFY